MYVLQKYQFCGIKKKKAKGVNMKGQNKSGAPWNDESEAKYITQYSQLLITNYRGKSQRGL